MILLVLAVVAFPQQAENEPLERAIAESSDSWWFPERSEMKRLEVDLESTEARSPPDWLLVPVQLLTELAPAFAVLVIVVLLTVIVLTVIRAKQNIVIEVVDDPEDEPIRLRRHLLPEELRGESGDLMGQAWTARREGRIRDAFAFFYAYVLLRLDAAHLIELHPSKTNYAYMRDLSDEPVSDFFGELVRGFELHVFGPNPEDDAMWDRLQDSFSRHGIGVNRVLS